MKNISFLLFIDVIAVFVVVIFVIVVVVAVVFLVCLLLYSSNGTDRIALKKFKKAENREKSRRFTRCLN